MRKLGAFADLSDAELAILSDMQSRRRVFAPGHDLVRQGQENQSVFVIAQGWGCSYKLLADGSRQIAGFPLPGDIVGLRAALLRGSDHSVEPVTPVEACEITVAELPGFLGRAPGLVRALLWSAARDEAILVEHLADIGQRRARDRTAHLLLELAMRLSLVGLGSREGYACPLSQYLIADTVGLSAVHVNRVLRDLREAGLLTFQRGQVTIHDFETLAGLVSFNPDYLDQDRRQPA